MTTSRHALEREIALEQAHVDKVYENLAHATAQARNMARQGREIFLSDRTNFLREEDGTALFERDAFAYQAAKRLAVLDAEHEGLVFGRLDLFPSEEVRYIGRLGVRDDDYEPLVLDWRAPAAEPFYRATPNNPMGVVRRRVLRCRDDKVIGLEDDLLDADAETDLPILGEGALMAALTRSRGRTMRDIVATIQAEQDEAIRAPYQGVTVIAGGPGTGKTVVALHRAAYLLYTNRARLEKGGVLVVGPSAVFMNYIERVLPSLGEDSVTLRAIGQVAGDVLGMASERMDEATPATIKGSLRMLEALRALVRLPLVDDVDALRPRVSVKGEVLSLTPRELDSIRDQVLARTKLNHGRAQAMDLVVSALVRKRSDELDLPVDEVTAMVREQASLESFMSTWWPHISATTALARLADPGVVARVAGFLTKDEQDALVRSYTWLRHGGEHGPHSEVVGWSVADMALLDELASILGPVPPDPAEREDSLFLEAGDVGELVTMADVLREEKVVDPEDEPQRTFAHILIDEGQDVTPVQWRMLRRRGPQASWTIVGDPAQSSYPNPEEATSAIAAIAGKGPMRRFTLGTNYRSPQEVFHLAAKVITKVYPDADLPHAVRATGLEPKLLQTREADFAAAFVDCILELAGQVSGTVGVIVPPSRLTPATKLVLSEERLQGLDERLLVVTALQAKGLEYDGVLVVDPDGIVAEAPGAERVLYVALTRATQRMTALDVTDATAKWRSLLE